MIGGEWPSERKLERLRGEGKVPYSAFAVACAVTAVLILWAMAAGDSWQLFLKRAAALRDAPVVDPQGTALRTKEVVYSVLTLLLVPAALALVTALAVGLAQTKFLLQPALTGFNLERVSPFKAPPPARLVLRVAAALLALTAFGALALLAARLCFPAAGSTLNGAPRAMLAWPYRTLKTLAPFAAAALAGAAFGAALFARLRFMLTNGMSREEVEAETRESG